MRRLPVTFVSLLVGLMLASAQTYARATLAGTPSIDYPDRVGGVARLNELRDVAIDHHDEVWVAELFSRSSTSRHACEANVHLPR